jgi:hypothetical protein
MLSRSAISRLQAIIGLLTVIIISLISNYYHYNFIKPRLSSLENVQFELYNMTIDPAIAEPLQPVQIWVEVTNIGGRSGSSPLELMINDSLRETYNVQLDRGASTLVGFNVTETTLGLYSVRIGNLSGTFNIQNLGIPDALELSNLVISPYEAWVNETVKISVEVSNVGDEAISCSLPLRINDTVVEIKTIQLSEGVTETMEFTVSENSEGTYSVVVGGLAKKFQIVPTGKHTLVIRSFSGIPFTIDGESASTQYSALLDVGTHIIIMPDRYVIWKSATLNRKYQFQWWEDGSTNPTRTIDLQSYLVLVPSYNYTESCPSLYVWDGTAYSFIGEVTDDGGWLGYVDYFREDGSIVFGYSDPWDYIKLNRSQTQLRNGHYEMVVIEHADEIFYLDATKLIVVDHASNVDVYSTADTYIYNFSERGKIYTVNKNPLAPISAVNGERENVLPQISKADGVFTIGQMWKWDALELNLGNLSGAKEIKLIVTGTTIWPTTASGGDWISQFSAQPGVPPQPLPYMEVKDASGKWVRVPDNRQFPILDVTPETFVVNLTGLFPTNNYSLKINTYACVRFDYVGVDTSPQQNLIIRELAPDYADLTQIFKTNSTSAGNFTRYGNVIPLVLEADDKFVIGREGDQVLLRFPADLEPVSEGMERDIFFVASNWFKGKGLPYLPFTVDPLPFHAMSSYLYPPAESYPYDPDHVSYLMKFNTRAMNTP